MDFSTFITTFNELYKETDEVYHRLSRHYGISDMAFWILYILREKREPLTQAALCARLFVSKQTVHSALKGLVTSGYLCAQDTGSDGREKPFVLTAAGLELCAETVDRVLDIENRVFDRLTPEERAGLLALEGKYLSLLREEAEKEMGVGRA